MYEVYPGNLPYGSPNLYTQKKTISNKNKTKQNKTSPYSHDKGVVTALNSALVLALPMPENVSVMFPLEVKLSAADVAGERDALLFVSVPLHVLS
jgi:hypothetical protein